MVPFVPSGSCLRLYPKSFLELDAPPLPHPRVCEENLSPLLLLLKRKQIAEPGDCHFLDRPGEHSRVSCCRHITGLGGPCPDGLSHLTTSPRSTDASLGRLRLSSSPG